jgi:hypothetical protein
VLKSVDFLVPAGLFPVKNKSDQLLHLIINTERDFGGIGATEIT